MRTIDIHAHFIPQSMWKTVETGADWFDITYQEENGVGFTLGPKGKDQVPLPKLRFTADQRINDMNDQGVDIQVVSVAAPLYNYHLTPHLGLELAQEVNNEISEMVRLYPDRFAGLATLPMQDVDVAIDELDRAVNHIGLKGAELDCIVNNNNWDEERFYPFFEAAEKMGAVLFYHPQPNNNMATVRNGSYSIPNSFGVLLEDSLVAATLIFGGALERYPDLKICIAHGGGPACFGAGRWDRGWQVRSEARINISNPPSTYLKKMYYDCITMSETALRFLIDTVGIDRVVLGSDWPYVAWDPSPVSWINNLNSLSQGEKEKILWRNLESLLNI